jgi:uncharacterized membrane protein
VLRDEVESENLLAVIERILGLLEGLSLVYSRNAACLVDQSDALGVGTLLVVVCLYGLELYGPSGDCGGGFADQGRVQN